MVNTAGKFGPYDQTGSGRNCAGQGLPRGLLAVGERTRVDLVRSRIGLQVRLGLLAPGLRLPDAGAIADELGISEITVRRALETMCQDGLLDRRRGRAGGTFVAIGWDSVTASLHDPARAAAFEDFHLLLECGLIASRVGEGRPPELTSLHTLIEQMNAQDEPGELLRLEALFHLGIAETLGGRALLERTCDLLGQLCLLQPSVSVATLRARNYWHTELIESVAADRLDAAIGALKAHRRACSAVG